MGQKLSTKYLRACDLVGTPYNSKQEPESFRTVERVETWGSVKHIYFTDGSRFDCRSATKLWISKP